MTPGDPWLLRQNARAGARTYETCCKLWRAAGFAVFRLSQARATRQTPGLPDLLCYHDRLSLEVTHEVKSGNARLTADQKAFAAFRKRVSHDHVTGDETAVYAYLAAHGLANAEPGSPTGYVLTPHGGKAA